MLSVRTNCSRIRTSVQTLIQKIDKELTAKLFFLVAGLYQEPAGENPCTKWSASK